MSNSAAMIAFAEAMKAAAEEFLASVEGDAEPDEAEEKPAPRKAVKRAPLPTKAAPAKKAAPVKKAAPKPAPEPEPEEDEEDGSERIDELTKMSLAQLRALAIKRGFNEAEIKAEKDKSVLAEAIAQDEIDNPDESDEDEDDDDTEDDGKEAQYDRADLAKKGLRELKALAKEAGHTADALKGLDQDSLIDLLLGEGEDDEDEDADAEDEDGEENFVTEEQLAEYSLAELKTLAKEYGLTIPRGSTRESLIELILSEPEE